MNDNYLIPLFVASTSLLSLFAFFLIAFLIVQKNKQNKYHTRLLQARLDEQHFTMDKISKEIHDNIGQILGLAQMNLSTIENNSENSRERQLLKNTNELVEQVLYDLHNISHSLNGDYIKRLGLSEVLKKELDYIEQAKNMRCTMDVNDDAASIDKEKEVVAYRIAQEAIHNAIKHANAGSLHVYMRNDPMLFLLAVTDNGVGFEMNGNELLNGIGFENMKQRAALIGGKLAVESAPGKGTKITLTIDKK